MSRTRIALLGATLAFYLAIVVAVLSTSWLVELDWKVMLFRPYQQWPQLHAFLDYFVVLGQRGPTAVMVAAWLGWRSWRQHTVRPLLTLGAALLLLNITVGAVKLGLGRLGPHYATQIGSAELFMRRRYISFGAHRQRGRDLGNPGLSGHHPAGQALALGGLGRAGPGRRRHHGLPRYALAERCAARLGRRAAGPAGPPLVRAADRPRGDRGLRGA